MKRTSYTEPIYNRPNIHNIKKYYELDSTQIQYKMQQNLKQLNHQVFPDNGHSNGHKNGHSNGHSNGHNNHIKDNRSDHSRNEID